MKKEGNKGARKFRSTLVSVLLLSSVVLAFIPTVEAAGESTFGLIANVQDVEVGDDFYLSVFVDGNISQPAYGWKIENISFDYERVGMCNATEMNIVNYGYWTQSPNPGTIYNDSSYIWNSWATETPTKPTSDNVTGARINFTALSCGTVYFNMSGASTKMYDELGNPWPGVIWHNTTVTIHPVEPAAIGVTTYNHTAINITFTPGAGELNTTLCGKEGDFPTDPTDSVIYNGSANFYNDTGLDPCTTYYYRVWTWNDTEGLHSITYRQGFATTDCYTNFSFTGEVPTNTSTTADCTYDIPVNVTITNSKGHTMYYWINGSDGSTESGVGACNQSVSILMNGLSHDTVYWWNVTARDATGSGDEHSESYWFTTGTGGGSPPGTPDTPSPVNHAPSIPVNLALFSVGVSDPDGDAMNTTFYWANGTVIGYDASTPSGGTATISPSLNLLYGIIYQWYVVVNDSCVCTRGPSSGYWDFTTDELDASITKEYFIHDNSTIQFWINITNTGEANMTNLVVLDTYDSNLNFISSNPPPDVGGDTWYIPYLNMSGFPDDSFEIILWMELDGQLVNGTLIGNLVSVSNVTIGFSNVTLVSTLEVGLIVEKTTNLTALEWNSTRVNYTISVTNTGDFPLHNVTVNETYDANMTFESSNYGVNPNFNLGTLTPGQTKNLWIICTTSYLDTGDILINATRHYNNVTAASNETTEVAEVTYLFVGAQTESVRVIYDTSLTDVADIGNSVLNILGVLLIIAAIFLIILVVQKAGLFGGE